MSFREIFLCFSQPVLDSVTCNLELQSRHRKGTPKCCFRELGRRKPGRACLTSLVRGSSLFRLFILFYTSLQYFKRKVINRLYQLGFYLSEYKRKTQNNSILNKIEVYFSLIDKKSETRQFRAIMVVLLSHQDPRLLSFSLTILALALYPQGQLMAQDGASNSSQKNQVERSKMKCRKTEKRFLPAESAPVSQPSNTTQHFHSFA